MKIHIITSHGIESSRELAIAIKQLGGDVEVFDVRKQHVCYLKGVVFSYGCSEATEDARKRYNRRMAVKRCVDKVATFEALKKASVPIPRYTTNKEEAKEYPCAVVRTQVKGRKNEGLDYWQPEDGPIPDAKLYTEYFHHVREYRVVVCPDDEVFIYYKKFAPGTDEWVLTLLPPRRKLHADLIAQSRIAAKVLGIDYVGFDVLANSRGEFKFLEANSCPILCPEVEIHLANYLIKEAS